MFRKNQSGFGVIEAILIIVVIGIIGGAGWYVWKSQNETKDTLGNLSSAQNDPQKTEKKPEEKKTYFEIKELATKIPFDNRDGDLYVKQPQPDLGRYAYGIYSKKLDIALKKNCPVADYDISLLDSYKVDGLFNQQAQNERSEHGATPHELLKQFDQYHITQIRYAAQAEGEKCSPGYKALQDRLLLSFKDAEKM